MVGVNQCLMAALSMVIIAAVIGGFDDIGWEVLLTMRKAQFGQSLLAGLVIVIFAILIDRMSGTLTQDRRAQHDPRVAWGILALGVVVSAAFWGSVQQPGTYALFNPVADSVDRGLSAFTSANAEVLTALKNNVLFYVLLPLRIGLDQAVLPFTWGFSWTPVMSLALFAAGAAAAVVFALRGQLALGVMLLIAAGMLETGISQLPWPFVLAGAGALAWVVEAGAGWQS